MPGVPAGATISPLYVVLAAGGVPLVVSLARQLIRREFGADLLAGISIVAAVVLEEYLAYTTEESAKMKAQQYVAKWNGDIRKGIAELANDMRTGMAA